MKQPHKKIYFVSDAHLGARFHQDPREVERKLVRWLDQIKADAQSVWLLGDMFDYWYEYKYVVPKGHVRFLGKLAELADSGIEIHLFIGNHDIWMFDYLPQEIGAIIHREPLTIDLWGKRFFLGHGDEVDDRSLSFRLIRWVFRNRFCQWLYAAVHPRWTFGFALGWSLNSRKKGLKKYPVYEFLGEDNEYMISFARDYLKTDPSINFFIFGHRHLLFDFPLNETARLIITGDWMTIFSYVEWDGETLAVKRFEEKVNL